MRAFVSCILNRHIAQRFPIMPRFVLITGCSSGIGLAAAQALGQHGFTVIASARKAEDVARLQQQGLLAVQLDLADPASIELGASAALHLAGGRLYGLFNNGAYGQPYHQCQMFAYY